MTSNYMMLLDALVERSNLLFFATTLPTLSLQLWELGVWCQLMLVTRSVGPLCCGGICHRAPVTLMAYCDGMSEAICPTSVKLARHT